MKKKVFCTLALLICFSFAVKARSFYVVIASFTKEIAAKRFSRSVSDVFENASFRFDTRRNLFHVFVMQTHGREEAENFRKHLQLVMGFNNVWIFIAGKEHNSVHAEDENGSGGYVKLELYTGSTVLLSSSDNSYMSISRNEGEVQQTTDNDSGQAFTFIAKTPNGHMLPARVVLLDNDGNQVSTFKTNQVVGLSGKNGKERMTLVCDARGYSTETKVINLRHPEATPGVNLNGDDVWEVAFNMSRMKPDQVEFVYRGLFHKDASVVEHFGKKNIEVLLALLTANPGWRIVINSHTNPRPKRQIAVAASEDIFDVSLARSKEASDKQLTRERAQVLQNYLVAAGIAKERITAMGWGSLAKVTDPTKSDAHFNDRVEVELMMN